MVSDTPMLWEPLRYLESCPSSDGACAMVITSQDQVGSRNVAWIKGMAGRSEGTLSAGRDEVNPQAGIDCAKDIYNQAGIKNPFNEIDCAEIYVPFSWYEPMWLENLGFCDLGEGWKLTDKDATAIDGELPFNMSGGVLSSNPIGASGMIRFGEAALQVMGLAEDHQVEDAKVAMGHAYGGAAQFFAMWIVSSSLD